MSQLTIRGLDPALADRIQRISRQEGISLNKAALRLLRKGAGFEEHANDSPSTVGASLDHLCGTWTEEEEREFLAAIEPCGQVDEEMWK